jgi:hypothetical protein
MLRLPHWSRGLLRPLFSPTRAAQFPSDAPKDLSTLSESEQLVRFGPEKSRGDVAVHPYTMKGEHRLWNVAIWSHHSCPVSGLAYEIQRLILEVSGRIAKRGDPHIEMLFEFGSRVEYLNPSLLRVEF